MPLVLHGCSVQVLCDGREMEQFDVRQENDDTISCWIASQEGQAFTVNCDTVASAPKDNLEVRVYMDGRLTNRIGHRPRSGGSSSSTIEGVIDGPGLIRPFEFAPLVLTDEEALASSRGMDDKLGTIQLNLYRVESFTVNHGKVVVVKVDDIGPVHERSKKAGVHAISLGDVIAKPTMSTHSLTAVGREDAPFAKFTFRYRPLALLQANGLAPRPSPSTSSKKRRTDDDERTHQSAQNDSKRQRQTIPKPDVKPEPQSDSQDEDDDEDDVTFLEEQLVLLQQRLAEKKGKKKAKASVKREPSPICVPAFGTNEVIDLT